MKQAATKAGGSAPRFALHAAVLACAGLFLAAPAASQSQGGAAALGILQQLIQPGQAGAPAQGGAAGGLLGNALSGGGIGAGGKNAAAAGTAADLMGLLSQSTEQIDEPKEIEIGRQLAAVLLGSKPLYPDMAMQHYVNQLGRWISLQSSRPDLPWTFAVLDDTGFNAFAAPGGYVFVTKGLIDRVADESELAGILAHEINHVVQKHHLAAIRKNARAGMVTKVIGSQLNNNLGGAISAQLLSLGKDLYSKGLDQEDEFESDRNGVALAARAGFDPYGLVAVLQQLRSAAPENPVFSLSLSTHPPAQQRMDQVELAMGNRLDALTGKPAVTVPQRLELLAAADRRQNAMAAAAAAAAAATVKPAAKPVASGKPAARPAAAPATRKKPAG